MAMLWGWEKYGCWMHGDYFPPWGGWDAFDAAIQGTKQKDDRWYLLIGPSYLTTSTDVWKEGSLKPSAMLDAKGNVILVENGPGRHTGAGPFDNPVADGVPTPSLPLSRAALPASATIEGAHAPIAFLGLTPGFVGLVQANIQVPKVSAGDHPLVITIGGVRSNSALVTVK